MVGFSKDLKPFFSTSLDWPSQYTNAHHYIRGFSMPVSDDEFLENVDADELSEVTGKRHPSMPWRYKDVFSCRIDSTRFYFGYEDDIRDLELELREERILAEDD